MAQGPTVRIRIAAQNDAGRAFSGFRAQVQRLSNEIREAFGSRLTQALSFGAVGFGIRQVAQAAAELQASLTGLASVAQAFGEDAMEAQRAAQALASDGLMTVADAATGLKNLLAAGFSLPQAITLMERFKDSAAFGRQGALSFGEAVVSATEGLKNGNSILVDNAGVTKNLSTILVEAGFSAQDLSRASQDVNVRMALFNGILRETLPQLGNAALFAETAAGQYARMGAELEKTQQIIGLKMQPVLLRLARGFNTVVLPAVQFAIGLTESLGVTLGSFSSVLEEVGRHILVFFARINRELAHLAAGAIRLAQKVPFLGHLLGLTSVDDATAEFFEASVRNFDAFIQRVEAGMRGFANIWTANADAMAEVWQNAFATFAPTVTVPGGGGRVPSTPVPEAESRGGRFRIPTVVPTTFLERGQRALFGGEQRGVGIRFDAESASPLLDPQRFAELLFPPSLSFELQAAARGIAVDLALAGKDIAESFKVSGQMVVNALAGVGQAVASMVTGRTSAAGGFSSIFGAISGLFKAGSSAALGFGLGSIGLSFIDALFGRDDPLPVRVEDYGERAKTEHRQTRQGPDRVTIRFIDPRTGGQVDEVEYVLGRRERVDGVPRFSDLGV